MHIAFLTLFLGLVAGRVPIELAVTGPTLADLPAVSKSADPETVPINAIELLLDGKPAGRLTGPLWKGEVDLGKDLLPHHLEARGLDAAGAERARTEQWVNLPQPPATVEVTPETLPGGRIAAARISFRSLTHETPTAVTATLDGAPLPVAEGRVVLPSYRADLPHLLTVEALFSTGRAHRDLAFGGGLEGEVATELTAVVVRSRASLPAPAALAGSFVALGRPLTPVAVEDGPGEILVVRDPGVAEALHRMSNRASIDSPLASSLDRSNTPWQQSTMPIGEQDRVRLVDANATWYAGEGSASAIFGVSQELGGKQGGLFWWLTHASSPAKGPAHLADAVAVAGVKALADQRRRAVLLLLSGDTADVSRWDPQAVRRYLEAIRVPLYVWSLRSTPFSPAVAAWGKVEDTSTFFQMNRAYRKLTSDLGSQRIVWLDGRHLPQSIALAPQAAKAVKGLELVAGPER